MFLIVEPGDTGIELQVPIIRNGAGVSGLTVLAQIRNGDTDNSYLDFSDNVFKTSGWTTKQVTLVEVPTSAGIYRYLWNSSLAAAVVAGFDAIVEYDVSGSISLRGTDYVKFRSEGGGGASAAAIADAVWDEALADHLTAGSTGEALDAAQAGSSPSAIADAVLDELLSGHAIAGSLGAAITSILNATASIFGDGSISVGTNYGGANALKYETSGGAGVDNAVIRAYLKSDYDAGNTGEAFVQGRTMTKVGGIFIAPLMLDAAVYTLVYEKQNEYGPDTVEVTVA